MRLAYNIEEAMLVVLPGWAFDARILALAGNWAESAQSLAAVPTESNAGLLHLLDSAGVARADLCGWSLGAMLALDFAREHPQRVRRVCLAGLRPAFAAEEIAAQRAALRADPDAALRHFYRRAFAGQKRDWERFAAELLPQFLTDYSLPALEAGLDYLAARRVSPEELAAVRPKLAHGRRDLIAPLAEIEALAAAAGMALQISDDAGHAVLLSEGFAPG